MMSRRLNIRGLKTLYNIGLTVCYKLPKWPMWIKTIKTRRNEELYW